MIPFGSVTNFGLGKLVANNFMPKHIAIANLLLLQKQPGSKSLLLKPHTNFVIFQSL